MFSEIQKMKYLNIAKEMTKIFCEKICQRRFMNLPLKHHLKIRTEWEFYIVK